MGEAVCTCDDPDVDEHEESGIRHTSGNAEWAAEYRSLELRQRQSLAISGLCPAWNW